MTTFNENAEILVSPTFSSIDKLPCFRNYSYVDNVRDTKSGAGDI